MSRNEDINNAIWSDPDWLVLTPEAKLVYFWAFTNPRCGMAGLYKVTREQAALETGLANERLVPALEELAEHGFAFYEDHVLFVRARVKRLRQKTVPIAISIGKDLANVSPSHPLRAKFMVEYGHYMFLQGHLPADPSTTLTRGSVEGQEIPMNKGNWRGSREGRSTLYGKGNGKGKGGVGKEGGPGGGNQEWFAWAERHVPDLPASFVASAAQVLSSNDFEVTPDRVRRRVLAQHPGLEEAA